MSSVGLLEIVERPGTRAVNTDSETSHWSFDAALPVPCASRVFEPGGKRLGASNDREHGRRVSIAQVTSDCAGASPAQQNSRRAGQHSPLPTGLNSLFVRWRLMIGAMDYYVT